MHKNSIKEINISKSSIKTFDAPTCDMSPVISDSHISHESNHVCNHVKT
jgi:hypothetical protein